MKNILLSLCMILSFTTACTTHHLSRDQHFPLIQHNQTEHTTGNLIIYYSNQTGAKPLLTAAQSYGAKIIYQYQTFNAIALKPPPQVSTQQATAYFQRVKGVISISPDRIVSLDDPLR